MSDDLDTEGTSGGDIGTANTMSERAEETDARFWLLMRANRLWLTAGLTFAVFVAFVLVVAVLRPPFARQVSSSSILLYLFSSMLTAIVTEATLVVSIGQLVLTQENGPLGDQRSRMSNTLDFRTYTEEVVGGPVPADPSALLRQLVDATSQRAVDLQEGLGADDDQQLREEVDEFTDSLVGNADEVADELDGASFGTFDVLLAALNFNYGWKIFQVDRIASKYNDEFDEAGEAALDDLKTALSLFGPAREHIKTLYFQWELISFSQLTLYVAVPALVVAGLMVSVVNAGTFPGQTLGVENIVLVTGAAFAFTLTPFLLFVSYLLRILTVAKRTLAIGPFILRESQR